jgi:tetratricopeptide (TPR) repeat protein
MFQWNNLVKIIFVFSSIFICSPKLSAVTPQVKFPDWHSSSYKIQDWDPKTNIITIKLELSATTVALKEISSKIFWSKEFKEISKKEGDKFLPKGKKTEFIYKAKVLSTPKKWLECNIYAMPDKLSLKAVSQKEADKSSFEQQAINSEIDAIDKPMTINYPVSIYLDKNIAVSDMPQSILKADWKEKSHSFFFWYPSIDMTAGFTKEAFKPLFNALNSQNLNAATKACDFILKLIKKKENSSNFNFDFQKAHYSMPPMVCKRLINGNLLSLRLTQTSSPEKYEKEINNFPDSYTKAYVLANLGTAFLKNNNSSKAKEYYQKALTYIPAWPQVKRFLKATESK